MSTKLKFCINDLPFDVSETELLEKTKQHAALLHFRQGKAANKFKNRPAIPGIGFFRATSATHLQKLAAQMHNKPFDAAKYPNSKVAVEYTPLQRTVSRETKSAEMGAIFSDITFIDFMQKCQEEDEAYEQCTTQEQAMSDSSAALSTLDAWIKEQQEREASKDAAKPRLVGQLIGKWYYGRKFEFEKHAEETEGARRVRGRLERGGGKRRGKREDAAGDVRVKASAKRSKDRFVNVEREVLREEQRLFNHEQRAKRLEKAAEKNETKKRKKSKKQEGAAKGLHAEGNDNSRRRRKQEGNNKERPRSDGGGGSSKFSVTNTKRMSSDNKNNKKGGSNKQSFVDDEKFPTLGERRTEAPASSSSSSASSPPVGQWGNTGRSDEKKKQRKQHKDPEATKSVASKPEPKKMKILTRKPEGSK